MSLRTRIAVLVGITVLLASAVGGIGTAISSRDVGQNRVDKALLGDADQLDRDRPRRLDQQLNAILDARRTTCTGDTDDQGGPDRDGRGPGRAPRIQILPGANLQRIRPDGTAVAACDLIEPTEPERQIAATGSGRSFRTTTVNDDRVRILTVGYGGSGAVQFQRGLAITDDTVRSLLGRTVGFGLLGAALAAALGWAFAKRAMDPLEQLNQTADRVAHTLDLGERIDVAGGDEVGQLASSFNTMLSSLDTSREQQRRLVQDASHELRTPLTSMRTNIEMLQRYDDIDPTVRAQVLADISTELDELTSLTSELVDSATEIPADMNREQVDLIEVVRSCAEHARRRYRRNVIVTEMSQPAPIMGDELLLARCVTNLINNAAKFSPDDTDIGVRVSSTSVAVIDQGPGIPEADLPHVFDRFYRATTARSSPGSGLGLAIVQQVVTGHGGEVVATNRAEGGAEISFELPGPA